ncbi:hypothetical protein RvY_08206-4 [Ramazzottius varieornatus]|uniref:Uncharacterized protein n=1 Tax=Ramazzottius varieornatus TaxID=947166 RepID=A0A1D1V4Z5_RAMVA|nr:hypothetical protein RvY_08206-4 [Ramazzottius varieornatus]
MLQDPDRLLYRLCLLLLHADSRHVLGVLRRPECQPGLLRSRLRHGGRRQEEKSVPRLRVHYRVDSMLSRWVRPAGQCGTADHLLAIGLGGLLRSAWCGGYAALGGGSVQGPVSTVPVGQIFS